MKVPLKSFNMNSRTLGFHRLYIGVEYSQALHYEWHTYGSYPRRNQSGYELLKLENKSAKQRKFRGHCTEF